MGLDFAVFLLGNDTLLADPSLNADVPRRAMPSTWNAKLPFFRFWPTKQPTAALEVVELDMENITHVQRVADISKFDTFVTISFGHFVPDFQLIQLMPAGSRFVFCVANFGTRKGVRRFQDGAEIRARYQDYLDIVEVQDVHDPADLDGPKRKFVVSARVKASKPRGT